MIRMESGCGMKNYAGAANAALSRSTCRAILGVALAATMLSAARAVAESANTDYKRGQDAEARQNYDAAFADYQKAFQRNPKDLRYRMAFDRVRTTDAALHVTRGRQLFEQGKLEDALTEFLRARDIDPANEAAQQGIDKVRLAQGMGPEAPAEIAAPVPIGEQRELEELGSPVQLRPISNEPITLHMNEDAKTVYQAIGKAAGINVLFDPDYSSKRVQVDLSNVTLLQALRIMSALSDTFWRPVTTNTIFVAQNTRVKRTEMEEQAVQTFYLTNAWQQNDLNDVQTALRNVLPDAKVYGVASQNAIVMRATPDELLLAQQLIEDLDKPRPEVVVDFAVLEVSKNWERNLGIDWPSSYGVALQNPTAATTNSNTTTTTTTNTNSTAGLTLSNLSHLNSNDFAVNIGAAQLNLLLTNSNTQILQDPRIRATDGQKATLTIGSKIPIATGSYSTPGLTAGAAIGYAQTQFQYIDVGVKIEVTPTVHYDNDVTLKVQIGISSESGNVTIEGVTEPILSQRVSDQVIRLKEGEASILSGINEKQIEESWSGIPGLSHIPILRYLFGSKDRTTSNDEIVFVVIPHVVRGQELDQENLRAIDTGQGQTIDLRRLPAPFPASTAPAPHPASMTEPGYGTVPAGSAPEAAAQALGQMRANSPSTQPPPPRPEYQPQPGPQPPISPQPPPQANAQAPPIGANVPPAAKSGPLAVQGSPAPAQAARPLSLTFVAPAAPVAPGATFQVPVQISGGSDIASVPLQFLYDPSKLTLENVEGGDFLNRGGQATALIHRDDGPGSVTIVASRPPGSPGVSGSGVLCVLTFQAKAAGPSSLVMTRAGAVNSKQQQTSAQLTQAEIVVK